MGTVLERWATYNRTDKVCMAVYFGFALYGLFIH